MGGVRHFGKQVTDVENVWFTQLPEVPQTNVEFPTCENNDESHAREQESVSRIPVHDVFAPGTVGGGVEHVDSI